MTNILMTLIAYFIDRFFGEFEQFRHPVAYIGDMIIFYEKHFYKDSIVRGLALVVFITCTIGGVGFAVEATFTLF